MFWLDHHWATPQTLMGVRSPEAWLGKAQAQLDWYISKGFPVDGSLKPQDEHPDVYVNHGGWVVDCRVCGVGICASREWNLAVCCNCGAVYKPHFPAEADRIEQLLMLRPSYQNRNWEGSIEAALRDGRTEPETVDDLVADNITYGIMDATGRVLPVMDRN